MIQYLLLDHCSDLGQNPYKTKRRDEKFRTVFSPVEEKTRHFAIIKLTMITLHLITILDDYGERNNKLKC